MRPAFRCARSIRRLLLRAALLGVACAAFAPAAHGQHPGVGRARSLPARLALADAIVIATVAKLAPGRFECAEVRVLTGQVGERFEVKRAPGAPPPLGVGDRALLLLRGARPPYVLVDQPEETIRLADARSEARWSEAIEAWFAVRERPAAWIPLYLQWIDEGPDTLRDLGVNGLTDPAAPFQPIPAETLAGFGRAAWDSARSPAARRSHALLASLSPTGSEQLVEGLLAAPTDADSAVALVAIQAASRQQAVATSTVLARGLDHTDAEVRRSALQAAQALRGAADAPLRARIERIAREDAESWLRAEAERTLAALGL